MRSVKIIMLAMEIVSIIGVIMFTYCTDWAKADEAGTDWMTQALIVGCALLAVAFQREQQDIDWYKEEDEA